jgi:hypothetical protein
VALLPFFFKTSGILFFSDFGVNSGWAWRQYVRAYQDPGPGAPVGLATLRQLTAGGQLAVSSFSRDISPGTSTENLAALVVDVISGGVSIGAGAAGLYRPIAVGTRAATGQAELSEARQAFLAQMQQRARQLELSKDAARGETLNYVQGAGGVHLEQALGRKVLAGTHEGVDFVDSILGDISLKGPLPARGSAEGLANSVIKDALLNTSTKVIVVDLTGLEPKVAALVRALIQAGTKNSPKRIIFIG